MTMAWFTRFDRFGDMHFVYGQERENTCGPSSVMMCVMKINKLAPGHAALYMESTIRADYAVWQGKPYNGRDYGTFPEGLVSILNSLNCGRWTHAKISPQDSSQKLIDLVGTSSAFSGPSVACNPVIIGVNWDGSSASHWVCIDGVRSVGERYWATVCDPADADLHVQSFAPGKPFVYEAAPQISFDLWGERNANAYAGGATGRVRDWPFIYRTS
jgi:hypothetical protein